MSELVTDAMVEAVAKRLDPDAWEMTAGVYQESHGRHYGNAESFIQSARQTARGEARAILRLVAPAIAAKAWDEGYAMSEREMDHAYGGHPISPDDPSDLCHECGTGNPYRADHIQRGES